MNQEKCDIWAVIGLFGHQKIAGRVQEKNIGGSSFLQVDVPETKRQPAFTRLLNPSAIYDINPVTQEVAQQIAENLQVAPIITWNPYEFMAKVEQRKLELAARNLSGDREDESDYQSED